MIVINIYILYHTLIAHKYDNTMIYLTARNKKLSQLKKRKMTLKILRNVMPKKKLI